MIPQRGVYRDPSFRFLPRVRHTRVTRAPHVVIARTHTQSHTLCTRADGEIDVEVLDFELRASITGHTRAHCTLADSVRERESRTHQSSHMPEMRGEIREATT